jgi:hypothetical protein
MLTFPQVTSEFLLLHLCQHLVLSDLDFSHLVILICVYCYLVVVLIFNPLIKIGLSSGAICTLALVEYLFDSFAQP